METLTFIKQALRRFTTPFPTDRRGRAKRLRIGGVHRRIRRKTSKSFSSGRHAYSPRCGGRVPKRILVVEDDPLIIETIVRSLEEEPYDYEIVSAADGIEAGSQVSNFSPDLLILDIMMPNIDGHEVCRQEARSLDESYEGHGISAYLDEENYEK
jgi:PleD family two-component response regulator